jgi:hypothetical protein
VSYFPRLTYPRGLRQLDPSDPINQGLVGYWSMDGSTIAGTTLRDLSGKGNNGTLVGSPPLVNGITGQALSFNGSSQYVSTNLTNVNFPSGTISWRQNLGVAYNSGTDPGPWGGVPASGGNLTCQIFTDNNWYVGWSGNGGDQRVILAASSTNAPQNAWADYCFMWSATGSLFYQNGVLIGSTSTPPGIGSGTAPFLIGRYNSSSNAFTGAIEEFRFLGNVTLFPAEISRLYSDTSGNLGWINPVRTRAFIGATGGPTNLTISLATWSWGTQALSANQRQDETISQTAAHWNTQPLAVDQKQEYSLPLAAWRWATQTLGVNQRQDKTLSVAPWNWTGSALNVNQRQDKTITQTAWSWVAAALSVDQKQMLTIARTTWNWAAYALTIPGTFVARLLMLLGVGR